MREITEEVLIKASEGDVGAFEVIYRATSGFVYNVVYRTARNAQDAEEVTQEVFLKIYRNLKFFRFGSSLKTWVYRIAVNCAVNHLKKSARESEKMGEYRKDADLRKAPENESAGIRRREETTKMLLSALSPDQRLCVILRSVEGLSYKEIAQVMKTGINTVRSRLKRAREKILAIRREVVKDGL
jgi:RNA polymerase sigma-70 factor (ECF subfamily)